LDLFLLSWRHPCDPLVISSVCQADIIRQLVTLEQKIIAILFVPVAQGEVQEPYEVLLLPLPFQAEGEFPMRGCRNSPKKKQSVSPCHDPLQPLRLESWPRCLVPVNLLSCLCCPCRGQLHAHGLSASHALPPIQHTLRPLLLGCVRISQPNPSHPLFPLGDGFISDTFISLPLDFLFVNRNWGLTNGM